MPHCPRCGAELKPDSSYCHECGKDVIDINQIMKRLSKPKVKGKKTKSRNLKILIPIIAVIIGGLFGLVDVVLPYLIDNKGNFEIADISVEYYPENKEVCSLDIKVVNNGSNTVFITGVFFEVIESDVKPSESDVKPSESDNSSESWIILLPSFPSCEYHFDISSLERGGDNAESKISQVIKPGCTDRFLIYLGAPNVAFGAWSLRISLITSEGIFLWEKIIEVTFPSIQ